MAYIKRSGIYAIENVVDGKRYYGSTTRGKQRKADHFSKLRHNLHRNKELQSAWNKYGEAAFRFVWIKDVPPGQLFDAEQEYLDANPSSYNVAVCAAAPRRNLDCHGRGVYFDKRHNAWAAAVWCLKTHRKFWIGYFPTQETADAAVAKAKQELRVTGRITESHKRPINKVTSGLYRKRGYGFCRKTQRWQGRLYYAGIFHWLGYYPTEDLVKAAVQEARENLDKGLPVIRSPFMRRRAKGTLT